MLRAKKVVTSIYKVVGQMGNPYGKPEWTPKAQCGIYSSNVSKPQKHLTSPLPACCREQNDTNRKYCSAAGRVAELNNHYCKNSCV